MAKKQIEQTEIEAPYELPEGWKWCRLQDCSSIISKGTTPKGGKDAYVENGINFLRIENLNDDGSINLENISHITLEEHTNYLKRSILEEGDLLISIAGTLGKVGFVEKKDLPINTNQAIAFVRLYKNLFNNMYLKYAIESPFINAELISKTKVTSIPNLTLDIISNCTIPLPPTLEEQQRIVNRIETLFAKLDQAKQKAQNVVDTFETRKASILHKAFTGELTKKWREENGVGDDSWTEKKLEEICETIKIGPFGSSLHEEDYTDSGIPVINPKHIKDYQIIPSTYISTIKATELCFYQLKANDIILGRRGEMGRCAPITPREENWICGTGSIIVRLKNEYSAYIYSMFISSQKSIVFLNENAVGSTLKNLNEKVVKQLPVVDISFPEQTEIVRILDTILEKETKAKEAAEAVLEQIDLLKKSILARAFRGEL